MALADFGFREKFNVLNSETQPGEARFSDACTIETGPSRGGFFIRRADAITTLGRKAAGFAAATGLTAAGFAALALRDQLTFASDGVVGMAAAGAMLGGAVWAASVLRPSRELQVDRRGRAFHLVRRDIRGHETRALTVRFEEIASLSLKDDVSLFDLRNRDIARIEMIWQQNRKTQLVAGDISELEPLLGRLRREVGWAA